MLILKGVQDVEDARLAAGTGAHVLVVSNHGRRQLDGAPSSISALQTLMKAVGRRTEVHMDGGILSGQDVLKGIGTGRRRQLYRPGFSIWSVLHGRSRRNKSA